MEVAAGLEAAAKGLAAAGGLEAVATGLDETTATTELEMAAEGLKASAAGGLEAVATGLKVAATGLEAAATGLEVAVIGLEVTAKLLEEVVAELEVKAAELEAAVTELLEVAAELETAAAGLIISSFINLIKSKEILDILLLLFNLASRISISVSKSLVEISSQILIHFEAIRSVGQSGMLFHSLSI